MAWLGVLFVILTTWNAQTDQWRYNRFQTLFDAGDLERAAEVMDRQLEIAPDDATPHWNLALIREELGDYDGAIQHLRIYLAQFPNDVEAVDWLEELEEPQMPDPSGAVSGAG